MDNKKGNLTKEQKEAYSERFFRNDMEELKKVLLYSLKKTKYKEWDFEELLSYATMIFCELLFSFEYREGTPDRFGEVLISRLCSRIVDIKRGNRVKAKYGFSNFVELDAPLPDGSSTSDEYGTGENIEEEVLARMDEEQNFYGFSNEKFVLYIKSLSETQRKIAELIGQGYSNERISDILGIKISTIKKELNGMRDYHKEKVLYSLKKFDEEGGSKWIL